MTREDARDAISEVLFEHAADSPCYMGNGGPEIVAELILARLGSMVSYSRVARPQTSVWVVIEVGDDDDAVVTIHDPRLSYEAAEAYVMGLPERRSSFHFYQHYISGDIAEDQIVYALVEYERTCDSLTVDSIYISRAEVETAMASEKASVLAENLAGNFEFHIQQMKLKD